MDSPRRLSDEEIEHFKTHGYLVLKNFFDEGSIDDWRQQIWRKLGSSLDTPETWPQDDKLVHRYGYDPPESAFWRHPALCALVEQLGGGRFVYGHGTPKIRWPEPHKKWTMPRTGHIDGYGGEWLPLMLGATAYLYDVEPGGGAFTYWPDSHHAAHRYFLRHPSHLDGRFLDVEGFSWDVFCDNPATGGTEFIAEAGDLLLWHAFLFHNASLNVRPSPRVALIARFDHQDRDDPAFRYEVPEDLWKYWAI